MSASKEQMDQLMKLFGGLGTAGGGIASYFGGGQTNPADTANKEIDKIPGMTKPLYDPYMNAGKGALSDLQNQYGNLTNNTGDVYNKLAGGYTESPGYKKSLQDAITASNNAFASGGQLGSPNHEQANMGVASDIASKDFNEYMNKILGLYGTGLSGQSDINKTGYDATKGYADTLGNVQSQKGAYGFAGQQGENAGKSKGLSDIFSGIGTALPLLFL